MTKAQEVRWGPMKENARNIDGADQREPCKHITKLRFPPKPVGAMEALSTSFLVRGSAAPTESAALARVSGRLHCTTHCAGESTPGKKEVIMRSLPNGLQLHRNNS